MLSKSLWPTTALMLSLPWLAVDVRGHAHHHRDSWWKGGGRKGNLTITDPAKAALMKRNSDDTCITLDLHAEGFGSEYTAVMGVFGMARYSNLAYCHKRLESWAHPNSFTADEAREMIGSASKQRSFFALALNLPHSPLAWVLPSSWRVLHPFLRRPRFPFSHACPPSLTPSLIHSSPLALALTLALTLTLTLTLTRSPTAVPFFRARAHARTLKDPPRRQLQEVQVCLHTRRNIEDA